MVHIHRSNVKPFRKHQAHSEEYAYAVQHGGVVVYVEGCAEYFGGGELLSIGSIEKL